MRTPNWLPSTWQPRTAIPGPSRLMPVPRFFAVTFSTVLFSPSSEIPALLPPLAPGSGGGPFHERIWKRVVAAHVEEARRELGEDWWPYGFEPNRHVLETFLRYHHEQGLSKRRLKAEELFASETLVSFRV